jgi:hypothetical protein
MFRKFRRFMEFKGFKEFICWWLLGDGGRA